MSGWLGVRVCVWVSLCGVGLRPVCVCVCVCVCAGIKQRLDSSADCRTGTGTGTSASNVIVTVLYTDSGSRLASCIARVEIGARA
jgi:hypothetical protein